MLDVYTEMCLVGERERKEHKCHLQSPLLLSLMVSVVNNLFHMNFLGMMTIKQEYVETVLKYDSHAFVTARYNSKCSLENI